MSGALTLSRGTGGPVDALLRLATGRLAVYLGCWLLMAGFCVSSGKDLNWDSLNYHLYSGFAALNDRFSLDFMGASLPGYFNPYAYVPLYAMVAAGWPAVSIALALASIHTVALWLVYELAWLLLPAGNGAARKLGALGAVLLAFGNPIFLQEVGSTFSDLTTGVPVIGGWLLVARLLRGAEGAPMWFDRHGGATLAIAGALLGAAASLKLSNVMFALALLPALLWLPGGWRARARGAACYAAGGLLAALLVAGPWSWQLWRHFGNPLYPFFNGLFRSPDFVTDPIRHLRFVPHSLGDALLRPLRMALPLRMVHTEPASPDLRYAALLAVWAAAALRHRWPLRTASTADPGQRAALQALTLAFVLAWGLWLESSGNSRYFLPAASVAGALLVGWLARVCAPRAQWLVLAAILAAHGLHVHVGAQTRWTRSDWGDQWFAFDMPQRLRAEPYLYLSTDTLSGSVLVPFLHPGSGLINIAGSYALGPGVPGGARAQRMIEARAGALRSLEMIHKVRQDGRALLPPAKVVDGFLQRFGLRVDRSDCELIGLRDAGLFTLIEEPGVQAAGFSPDARWLSCAIRGGVDTSDYDARRRAIDPVFEAIERACPRLFGPAGTLTEHNGNSWRRTYLNTDLTLFVGPRKIEFVNPVTAGDPVPLGLLQDWLSEPQPVDCSRTYMPAFGKLDLRP